MTIAEVGAVCFGLVIGWMTYRTLRRKEGAALADIATVLGAVGGGVVTALFQSQILFGWYASGLAVGFFLYFVIALIIGGKTDVNGWMG